MQNVKYSFGPQNPTPNLDTLVTTYPDFGRHEDLENVRLNEVGIFSCAAGKVAHVMQVDARDVKGTRRKHFDVVTV